MDLTLLEVKKKTKNISVMNELWCIKYTENVRWQATVHSPAYEIQEARFPPGPRQGRRPSLNHTPQGGRRLRPRRMEETWETLHFQVRRIWSSVNIFPISIKKLPSTEVISINFPEVVPISVRLGLRLTRGLVLLTARTVQTLCKHRSDHSYGKSTFTRPTHFEIEKLGPIFYMKQRRCHTRTLNYSIYVSKAWGNESSPHIVFIALLCLKTVAMNDGDSDGRGYRKVCSMYDDTVGLPQGCCLKLFEESATVYCQPFLNWTNPLSVPRGFWIGDDTV